jgi:hypothetical protein
MFSEARQKELIRDCQHDVPAMLQRERQWIPSFAGKERGGLVWCDDCKVWIPFEFQIER